VNDIITNQFIKTMTSREIAELTDKEHKNVIRDIRTMLEELKKDGSDLSHVQEDKDARGYTTCFYLSRELTETLLTGYSATARLKVIRRWHELEAQAAKPVDPMQVLNDPSAMRGLLLTYTEKVLALQAIVDVAQPKAEALDRISTFSEGSMCITNAAKNLQIQPKKLFAWLQEHQWIYRRAGGSGWIGYQSRIQVGYLEHKTTTVERTDGSAKQVEQVLITAKGLAKLAIDVGVQQVATV